MQSEQNKEGKKIGLWVAVSLVVGNMIGVGVFTVPSSLASFGSISFFGWVISSLGALFLALIFGNLSKMIYQANGGPYVYTARGIGSFSGFLVAWGYWISVWVTNAAISVGFVGYLSVFFPFLAKTPIALAFSALTAIWFLVWVNSRGISKAGNMQLVTTILKLVPLFLVSVGGLFFINFDHFVPMNLSGESNWTALAATTTITFFAFLGVEAATIPAAQVENPRKNVSRATMIGTLVVIVVYILGSMSVMGVIPPETLAKSNAPFADAAAIMWGENARYFVAAGAMISSFGALNGWILIQGQIPASIAVDGLFPQVFAKKNKKGAPVLGIVIGSVLSSILMMMNYTKGLVEIFTFFVVLSTLLTLLSYLLSTSSYVILAYTKAGEHAMNPMRWITTLIAFGFSIWAVVGSGMEVVYYGFIMLMLGLPLFVWMKIKMKSNE